MANINRVAPYEGILEWKSQVREGVSSNTGNAWKSIDFTIMYLDGQMREQHIVFNLQNKELVDRIIATPLGTRVRVAWSPTSRSWTNQQGEVSWFPSFSAFSVVIVPPEAPVQGIGNAAPAAPAQPAGYPPQPTYQQPAPQTPVYMQTPPPAAAPAPAPAPAVPVAPGTPADDLPW